MSNIYLNAEGTFIARVEPNPNGWLTEIGQNNTPAIVIPIAVNGGPCDGQRIRWQGFLSDAALPRTIKTLHEVFNFNGDWGALIRDPVGFAGMDCQIVTEMETYEGKDRCKIKWLNALGGGGKKLDGKTTDSLVASLQGRSKAVIADLKAKATSDATPKKQEPAWADSGPDDGSIPF